MRRGRHILTVLMTVVLLCAMADGNIRQAYASSTGGAESEKPESEMTEEEKAEKEAREAYEKELQETYKLPVQTNELKGWPTGPGTYGDAAIVMDVDSGAILYAKNIDKKEYPASITKVLTALLAFQYADMDSQVTISAEALSCLGQGYASIGLKEGNVISMRDALYAMLLASANEAACAVGEAIAESQGQEYEWFLELMNETCRDLGGVNSNFLNTNGVFDENHYTCARDMALIGRALFEYPEFFEICQTQQYTILASPTVEEHVFQQKHHMMIEGNEDYDKNVIGGKTGYTTEAENTLITMADNGERRLICVVLKTYGGHPYSDTKALLDYGFNHFQKKSVAEYENDKEFEKISDDAYVMLPESVDFDSLDRKVELQGVSRDATVTYYYKDMSVGTCEVTVSEDYNDTEFGENQEREQGKEKEEKNGFKVWLVIGITVFILICVAMLSAARISRRRKRRRRRRRNRRR